MPSDPLILAFDTSAAHCAAALLSGDRLVTKTTEQMSKGQAERLLPLLEEVLAEGAVAWSDLTHIAVGVGPGNFTGIRIGVSTARGLALALGIPAIGVSMFQALAYGSAPHCVTAVKGPADKTYVQVMGNGSAPQICAPNEMPDYPARAEPKLIAFPDSESLNLAHALQAQLPKYNLSEAIARVAYGRRDNANAMPPAPLYLKATDAAPARDAPPILLPDDA